MKCRQPNISGLIQVKTSPRLGHCGARVPLGRGGELQEMYILSYMLSINIKTYETPSFVHLPSLIKRFECALIDL